MTMDYGGFPDETDSDGEHLGGPNCDCCGGTGIRYPAEPSCKLPDLPPGWFVVERCDLCDRYPDDLAAAQVVCEESMWVRCESGGDHAIGGPRGGRLFLSRSRKRRKLSRRLTNGRSGGPAL
jgi:hypothetical protein